METEWKISLSRNGKPDLSQKTMTTKCQVFSNATAKVLKLTQTLDCSEPDPMKFQKL